MPSIARVRWAKFRVAVLAVVSVVILCTLLYLLFGNVLLAPQAVVYLYINDASGIGGESRVRVDGIDVGHVSNVELSGSPQAGRTVKVTLLLYRDRLARIPADSVAQLSTDTVIGDKFVDVTSGTSPAALSPGAEITYKFQPELLRSLDLSEFTKELRVVDQTLADIEQGRSEFGKFYQGTSFYDDLQRRMSELQSGIRASVSTSRLAGSLVNSDRLYQQANIALVNIDQQLASVQSGRGGVGKLARDSAQYDQFVSKAQKLHRSVEALNSIELLRSDSTWVSINRTLAALIAKVDDFNRNPQLANSVLYDNLNGSLKELRNMVRDFHSNPRKYLTMKLF
jgi:phospholipid/cholesterol/gamma-HCH transport system substrate-binding protein